jgi:hypothetical protein
MSIGQTINSRVLSWYLVLTGMLSLFTYPLILLWPSAWDWGSEGEHYLHMIVVIYAVLGIFLIWAAKNPEEHRSFLLFTAWSSIAHGALMAVQAVQLHRHGHFGGDILALVAGGVILLFLMPKRQQHRL